MSSSLCPVSSTPQEVQSYSDPQGVKEPHLLCSFSTSYVCFIWILLWMLKLLLPRIGFCLLYYKTQTNKIQHWICCLVQCVELRGKPCLPSQRRAGNRFGASSYCGCLGDSGQFVELFNASPLPTVSPTFKKIQKIGVPKAKCFVGSGNRRSSKGSVSSCPSCSASSPFQDIQQSGVGRTGCPRARLLFFCPLSLSMWILTFQ